MKYKGTSMKPSRVRELMVYKKRREEWRERNIYRYERILKQIEEVR